MYAERSACTQNQALELVRRKEQQHLNNLGKRPTVERSLKTDMSVMRLIDPGIIETLREVSIYLAETREELDI